MSRNPSARKGGDSFRRPAQEGNESTGSSDNRVQPTLARGSKNFCLPFDPQSYRELVQNDVEFRRHVDAYYARHPELFPAAMDQGYRFHDIRPASKKLGVRLRRIELKATGAVFSLCPSFVMPYMSGFTTVKHPEHLPKHLLGDEKHTHLRGEKVYLATTVGDGCILGAALGEGADAKALTRGYGIFAEEARNLHPDYQPDTVNIDGWAATARAWVTLFTQVTIIQCFLHAFLMIRDRCKKAGSLLTEISSAVWDAYHAPNKRSFSQRIRRACVNGRRRISNRAWPVTRYWLFAKRPHVRASL